MEEKKESLEEKIERIEAQLLEQEHRPFSLIRNYVNRKKWTKEDPRRSSVKIALWWRLLFSPAAVAVTGTSIGLISLGFIYYQSTLIERQNGLFEQQNIRIEQQTHLLEADRRSAQVFLMGELLKEFGEELKAESNTEGMLSKSLVGRIGSLVNAMKPYRYLEGNKLIDKPISPEKGQIVSSLINSDLSRFQLENSIFPMLDLSYAELLLKNFTRLKLHYLTAPNANLRSSHFSFSRLNNANLNYSDLRESRFEEVYAVGLGASSCDFSHANLTKSHFDESLFNDAVFKHSNLDSSLFADCHLFKVDFTYANLTNARFRNSDCSNSIFRGCIISGACFAYSNLLNVDFHGAVTVRGDWLNYMKDSILIEQPLVEIDSKLEMRTQFYEVDSSAVSNYKMISISDFGIDYALNEKYIVCHKDSSLESIEEILDEWKISHPNRVD